MRFVDLFAGLGGFHVALSALGHECVFASEIDEELREIYAKNFPSMRGRIHGDIRTSIQKVPKHDILCAGFPCQPFSKSGAQEGVLDKTRGTLFHDILEILRIHEPKYVFLENVGNFERHDQGRTWSIVKASLQRLGYFVRGTEHVASGGHGLVSPHHLGYPHTRERFYVVASHGRLSDDPFPTRSRKSGTSLRTIEKPNSELTRDEREESRLPVHYVQCIDHWNRLLARLPEDIELPSFPIWGDEIRAGYPYRLGTPHSHTADELRKILRLNGRDVWTKQEIVALLPSYARKRERHFPDWKVAFIEQNRCWFDRIDQYISRSWLERLRSFPPSLRKLEWNCKGEDRNLWRHVLQFRPSGLRAKRYSASPALVAMTTSQIPILGPKRRFITRREALKLQGFNTTHLLPKNYEDAFRALGNAVHTKVVKAIAKKVLND
jgi:DNA (cytosine-5)-methyltransferase 1